MEKVEKLIIASTFFLELFLYEMYALGCIHTFHKSSQCDCNGLV